MPIDVDQISRVLSHPTWDVVVFLVFVAGGFFYGWLTGKARMVAVLIAIYLAHLIFINAQFLNSFTAGRDLMEVFVLRAVFFSALVGILASFFIRLIFRFLPDGAGSLWEIFFLSFAETGLLMSAILRLLPSSGLFEFSPLVKYTLASDQAFSIWLFLPLVALFITMRRR